MNQAHLFISGFVQGVGYRQFVLAHAKRLGVTGFVKNLHDRRVEVLAQGTRRAVEELIKECAIGVPPAKVENTEITWSRATRPFPEFTILT